MPLDLEPVLDLQPVETAGALDLQEIPATLGERAANAAVAFPQGLTTSVGQSISGAARTADTVRQGILLTSQPTGSARPTQRQRRRAFIDAMEDPRYFAALEEAGEDRLMLDRAESLFGPKAKLDVIRAPIESGNRQAADESRAQQERLKDSPTYTYGQGVVEAGREVYPTNPYLDTKLESKVTRALGSTAPTVALGLVPGVGLPAAVSQYALTQSEDMAQQAIDAGQPELATQAATAGLFIGAVSEATLGATARLKSILQSPTRVAALENWARANPIKAATLAVSIREGAQEGVEQAMQNLTASDVVGYDPDRPWHQDVLEAAGLGAITGALIGGTAATVTRRQPAPAEPAATPAAPDAEAQAELDAALLDLQPVTTEPSAAEVSPSPGAAGEASAQDKASGGRGEGGPQITSADQRVQTSEPAPPKLTPEQVMAREATAAMAELRAMKAQSAIGDVPSAIDPRPPATIEPATAPAAVENAPAAPEPAPPSMRKVARRAKLSPRPDGIPDVLDTIEDLGGIKAPGTQKGAGEYDGYESAFGTGPARALRGGTQRPDVLLQQLNSAGWNFADVDEMYLAAGRASAQREALEVQAREANTVRPAMVDRVQTLFDAAVAGQPVTSEELAELEGRLNQKELKALKTPLIKLRTLAGVAVPAANEPNAIQQAKAEVRKAWNDFTPTDSLTMGGLLPDPVNDARKVFNFYKALLKLAAAYARQGVKTAAEFAQRLGLELNAIVQAAWDDAVAGKPKSNPLHLDPGDVADFAAGMRERKFSTRFDADERMAPELRAATGNRTYLPIGNELTVTQAMGIIQEQGLDTAIGTMKDERNRDLSDRERVALGQAIVTKLNHEYAQTKSEPTLDKAVDVAEWLTEYGTRLGQGVQAFAIWNHLTPDGYVRAYVKAVNDAQRKRTRPTSPTRPTPPSTADPETKKKIHKMATEALRKPKGFQRDQALVDVLATIARAKGLNRFDMVIALWYANLLSGWTTQVRNLVGNLGNVLAETGAHAAVRPMAIPGMLAGLYNGALRGAFDAANILRTGKVTGTRVGKIEAPRALEMIHFKGLAYPLNAWKYVFRIMAATDMVFFRSAEEMRARFLGREIARTEGLKGNALTARLAELLHHTPADRTRAEAQARAEGLAGNAARRRVGELIEQARPEALVAETADYGRFATFNQPPAGALGVFARGIRAMSGQFPPLRLVVPFTNIVANVTNTALNFSPWGYRRLFPAVFLEQNWMSPTATPLDYQLQSARATLGTLGLSALYALAVAYKDDDDPPFAITANGPQDARRRNQLKETGWQPYSIKVGDRYVGYRETPLHLGLAYVGSLLDASRYKQLDERDAMTRAAYGLQQVGSALLNQSFLKSLGDFFESLSNDQVPRSGPKIAGLARTASGIVAPNLAKQIDKLFDPTVYDASTIEGALLRDVPVARRYLKPAVNVLGDAIRADQNPFYSVTRPDELWTTLAQKQAWISTPNRTTMIGDRVITPEEYYDWIMESGPAIRRRLEILIPALEISPPERAQDLVNDIVQEERRRARARMGILR